MPIPAIYSDAWREQYALSRYLAHLSTENLAERCTDLLGNVLAFGRDGAPRFVDLGQDTAWTRRIADAVAEADLRGLPRTWLAAVADGFLRRPFPRVRRAIEAWHSRDPAPGSYLVKYGSRDHMAALVERGLLRLT